MKFGLLILGEHSPAALQMLVREAERLAYDVFWYADEKFYRDPFIGLTLAAQASTEIQIGTCVTEPYGRHPALLAMAIGTLAEVSGGRSILGIGAGGSGFPPMGITRHSPATAVKEAVFVIRKLLEGQKVDYSGKVISFRGGQLNFAPLHRVPIYIAARGRKMLQAAGEAGDGAIIAPYASGVGLRYALSRIWEGAENAGRKLEELEFVARVDVCIADDRDIARCAVRAAVALPMWISYPNLEYLIPLDLPPVPEELLRVLALRDYGLIPEAGELVPDSYVDHLAVAGTAKDVVDQLHEVVSTGVNQVTIRPVPAPGQNVIDVVRKFALEVMPQVRES